LGKVFKNQLSDLKKLEKNNKRHTIMLVDDEPHMLRSLTSLLEEEYSIILARNGKEALEHVRQMEEPDKISLILCDQRMPGLTGIELLKRLKSLLPKTIRIILTAYDDVPIIIAAVNEAKIYEFILKPYEPEKLKLRVKLAIEDYEQK